MAIYWTIWKVAQLRINRQLTEHELTFLIHIKAVDRVSRHTIISLSMCKETVQKLVNSGILVESDQSDWYTVNNDVFEQ